MEGTASLWIDGKIFRVEKRARGSTALKQCLTEDLILFSNLREILPIQGKLRYTRHLLEPNFERDWNRANLLEIPLLYLMQNPECATQYSNDQFFILAKARSMFHLSVLEATYIKIRKPILCRRKEFVYSLQIFH